MPRTPKASVPRNDIRFCKRGHLRSLENLRTRIDKFGRSFSACRTCLAIYAKDYARRHLKPKTLRRRGIAPLKSKFKLKPIFGEVKPNEDPSSDTSEIRDLIHNLVGLLGLGDGDRVNLNGSAYSRPKHTTQARARSDDDPWLSLRAHVLLQALEDIGADPTDPDLQEWFFNERFHRRYDPGVVGTDFVPECEEGSPMWSIQQMSWMFHEIDQDGIFSLRALCYSLDLDIKKVRGTVASALGGKAIRGAIRLANAGARARKAGRHDPRPKPWHKVEADRHAPDRNIHNQWSIHFERAFEPPASWDEILRSPRISLDAMKAEQTKRDLIRAQNRARTRRWRAAKIASRPKRQAA